MKQQTERGEGEERREGRKKKKVSTSQHWFDLPNLLPSPSHDIILPHTQTHPSPTHPPCLSVLRLFSSSHSEVKNGQTGSEIFKSINLECSVVLVHARVCACIRVCVCVCACRKESSGQDQVTRHSWPHGNYGRVERGEGPGWNEMTPPDWYTHIVSFCLQFYFLHNSF